MTEAGKQLQHERIEQAARALGAEIDVTARQIENNARANRKGNDALWLFLLGVGLGTSLGALIVWALVSG